MRARQWAVEVRVRPEGSISVGARTHPTRPPDSVLAADHIAVPTKVQEIA